MTHLRRFAGVFSRPWRWGICLLIGFGAALMWGYFWPGKYTISLVLAPVPPLASGANLVQRVEGQSQTGPTMGSANSASTQNNQQLFAALLTLLTSQKLVEDVVKTQTLTPALVIRSLSVERVGHSELFRLILHWPDADQGKWLLKSLYEQADSQLRSQALARAQARQTGLEQEYEAADQTLKRAFLLPLLLAERQNTLRAGVNWPYAAEILVAPEASPTPDWPPFWLIMMALPLLCLWVGEVLAVLFSQTPPSQALQGP
jgi:hypothetical protein